MIKIRTFINGWNDRCQAFVWTKIGDPELVAKVTDVVGLYLNPRAPRGADDLSGGERPSPPDLSQQGR